MEQDFVILTDEDRFGYQFTKFPGGGLEFEEGILDCLKREFQEELNIEIHSPALFHVNENYVKSAFIKNDQIVSIYYLVKSDQVDSIEFCSNRFDFNGQEQIFRKVRINDLNPEEFRFPIDRQVIEKLKNQ